MMWNLAEAPPWRPRIALADCLFLSLIIWTSALPYLGALGFYSDDWPLLAMFTQSADQSLIGLFRHGYGPNEVSRPVYVLFLAMQYRLLGLQPLGYHLINHQVLVAAVCLFYLTLREWRFARLLALSVPLVFALLPHYATNRFWIAACHAFLSVALCFLSIYSDTKAVQTPTRFWAWRLLGLTSLVGSILTYELTIPLLFLNALLIVAAPVLTNAPGDWRMRRRLTVGLTTICVVVGVAVFTATATVRGIIGDNFFGHAGGVIKGAAVITLGRLGFGLPYTAMRAATDHSDPALLVTAAALAVMIFGYLSRVSDGSGLAAVTRADWARAVAFGPLLVGAGYAIFFATPEVVFTASGIGNRTAIVAALGVGMSSVGALGWAGTCFQNVLSQRRFFCAAITSLCLCGFVITGDVASYWASAYRKEKVILADIREHVGSLSAGSTLILDGICPYDGPAIVFESNWDLAGALQIAYRDPTLRADVVTPNLTVTDQGLTTLLYGHLSGSYAYGQKLLLYDYARKSLSTLEDLAAARHYFGTVNLDRSNGCPEGRPGHGVEIFSGDRNAGSQATP